MKTSLSLLNIGKRALIAVLSAALLNACGGGESVQLPRDVVYESLDGVANKTTGIFCVTMRSMVSFGALPYTHTCSSEPISLRAVIPSSGEMEPYKAEIAVTARVAGITPVVARALAEPDYFRKYDLLLVDVYTDQVWRTSIHSIKETSSRVEVCFTRVKGRLSGDSAPPDYSLWFAIPKTGKPVVVLAPANWDSDTTPPPADFPVNGRPRATA